MTDSVLQFAIQVLKTNHISARIIRSDRWDDAIPFDLGLREGILCTDEQMIPCADGLQQLAPDTIFHVTDIFGCLYTILRLPSQQDELLFLGPSLEKENWETLCNQISEQRNLPAAVRQQLRDYYFRLPKISLISGYHSVVLELGKYLYGERLKVRYVEPVTARPYDPAERAIDFSQAESPIVTMQMMEERYEVENRLLEAIRHGNQPLALQALQNFGGITVPFRTAQDLETTVQYRMVGLNANFRKEAEKAEVHPMYLNELSGEILSLVHKVKTEEDSQRLVVYMINSYCNTIKRYSMQGFSPVVRNVIRYATTHLNEDLSLRTLADLFSINRSYLSSLFRKETGVQLTEYINNLRVEYAATLLANHQISIAEVAAIVGIADVSYFTRVFKRVKFKTPAQFIKEERKKGIHAQTDAANSK